jgi:hypothetical protein
MHVSTGAAVVASKRLTTPAVKTLSQWRLPMNPDQIAKLDYYPRQWICRHPG